ncbi:YbhB/YbcL family Raf kinase inhibitor-like protein [Thermococcus sp.]|uniref:YbhB/YbcL family Raf kinase inhibitor-like protein n=1 Tax=Thermococcus sp. TaxID=35749 RepID=UPI0026020945|nr:YbhB/YbcL family Raf kinase inhibitor-like protein [Thermococcus sp.]
MRWLVPILITALLIGSGCISGGSNVSAPKMLEVGSVFHDGGYIPREFTCDGENINPPIFVGHVDPNAKSLVIIVDDPDAPGGTFTHWIAWNVPPLGEIPKGVPREGVVEAPIRMVQGLNDFGSVGYSGPCPPRGKPHHYHFKVYALDTTLDLPPGSTRKELERAMEGHVVQWGEIVGLYGR